MLGLNNNSSHRREEIIYTFKPRFLVHSKTIFLKLMGIIILIYSFGFLVNIMYKVQSAAINVIHLPLVQYSIYFIILVIFVIILWVISDLLKWYSKKYVLTDQRIISQSGLIRKKKSSIIYDKIDDMTTFQNLSSRLFSAGTIHIYGGHDGLHVVLEDVPNPDYVEEEINKLMSASWNRNRASYNKKNKHSNRREYYRHHNDYNDDVDDFDYIDRTKPSKPHAVNRFDNDYDKRYGYGDKSNYYDEANYNNNYSRHNDEFVNNKNSHNTNNQDFKRKDESHDFYGLNSNSNESFSNKPKLGFDDPKFWEDDYPEESSKSDSKRSEKSENSNKNSKESRDSFKKNRKKAMDKHSERFKIN